MPDDKPDESGDKPPARNWIWPLVAIFGALVIGAFFIVFLPRPFGWGVAAATLWVTLGCLPGVIVGKDGNWSTSKFQLFLWTGAIGYCLAAFVAFRCWALKFPGAPVLGSV